MSYRRWLHRLAFGTGLTGFLLVAPVLGQQPENIEQNPATETQQNQTTTPDQTEPDTPTQPPPPVAAKREEPADTKEPRCSDSADCAQKDLVAQQQMAGATDNIVELSEWQIVIAVFGLILSGFTVLFAWWAASAARDAARAAHDAVIEAREGTEAAMVGAAAAQRQVDLAEQSTLRMERPYLFLEVFDTRYMRNPQKNQPFLLCRFVNHGRTPAILQCVSLRLIDDSKIPIEFPADVDPNTYEVINPGTDGQQRNISLSGGREGEQWGGSDAIKLVLHGVAVYKDNVGVTYTDRFCLRAVVGGNNFIIEDGAEYNKRTTKRPDS